MDDRELAKGLSLLVDNVTLIDGADWRRLLGMSRVRRRVAGAERSIEHSMARVV
jgi:hypothetical protein